VSDEKRARDKQGSEKALLAALRAKLVYFAPLYPSYSGCTNAASAGGGVSPESLLFKRMQSHWCTISVNNRQPATMLHNELLRPPSANFGNAYKSKIRTKILGSDAPCKCLPYFIILVCRDGGV
jgi:hypothetical protein